MSRSSPPSEGIRVARHAASGTSTAYSARIGARSETTRARTRAGRSARMEDALHTKNARAKKKAGGRSRRPGQCGTELVAIVIAIVVTPVLLPAGVLRIVHERLEVVVRIDHPARLGPLLRRE